MGLRTSVLGLNSPEGRRCAFDTSNSGLRGAAFARLEDQGCTVLWASRPTRPRIATSVRRPGLADRAALAAEAAIASLRMSLARSTAMPRSRWEFIGSSSIAELSQPRTLEVRRKAPSGASGRRLICARLGP